MLLPQTPLLSSNRRAHVVFLLSRRYSSDSFLHFFSLFPEWGEKEKGRGGGGGGDEGEGGGWRGEEGGGWGVRRLNDLVMFFFVCGTGGSLPIISSNRALLSTARFV